MDEAPLAAIPERLNMADWFLDARVREGRGDRVALRTDGGTWDYAAVQRLANRFGNLLRALEVRPEERVIVALPDSPQWVGAFFGTLEVGAVVVMVNPYLKAEQLAYFLSYTRARAAIVDRERAPAFLAAAGLEPDAQVPADGCVPVDSSRATRLRHLLVAGDTGLAASLESAGDDLETFDSHRDDAAIWLFSGGTTGKPKAVVQSHASFVNTTRCYAHGVIGYREDDVTVSVPKLFFGYATGSNLLFPFSVGASAVLFPERCTPRTLLEQIERHRPTLLINVPTLINQMLDEPGAADVDLSCLRLATSAGEALPAELHARWDRTFGVELLDGLGTAEQWHVFLSNRPGEVKAGTLGKVVPGFHVKLCDERGEEVPAGEVGALWVSGGSRALGYWQRMERTMEAFRGEWYVSGDMLRIDEDGCYVYCGRADDMLKVSGKWLSPGEVENVLSAHPAVREVAVVGVEEDGLTIPAAWIVPREDAEPGDELSRALAEHVCERLESYKRPRRFEFVEDFPRTHLGKIDRGALKRRGADPFGN